MLWSSLHTCLVLVFRRFKTLFGLYTSKSFFLSIQNFVRRLTHGAKLLIPDPKSHDAIYVTGWLRVPVPILCLPSFLMASFLDALNLIVSSSSRPPASPMFSYSEFPRRPKPVRWIAVRVLLYFIGVQTPGLKIKTLFELWRAHVSVQHSTWLLICFLSSVRCLGVLELVGSKFMLLHVAFYHLSLCLKSDQNLQCTSDFKI